MLTNKQLDHAFMCKCGHLLANLHSSSWNEWRGPGRINQDVFRWLQNSLNEKKSSKWIIHAQHCNLKLLIKAAPEETRNFDEFKPIKADKFAEFPVICPYAYAYVFWKTSLLKEENFYCDNLCRTNNTSYRAPLIIKDQIEYFVDQIVNHQMSSSGGIDPDVLFWVLEKIVTQFSMNFFKAWLRIAGNRSQETSVSSWKEIEKMRDLCFPNLALKYIREENSSSSFIEYYNLNAQDQSVIQYSCPYQDELSKEAIQSMISFTPQKISMFVMSHPDQENLQLQKSVDLYVKK